MESGTAALRKAAPEWNLAGDRNLLQVLEDIHQKLMTKCQEVNTKLDKMVYKLDNASVDLQNVNNKFLALSNSQFIESRVYDDDVTSEAKQEKKTDVPVNEENELSKLKHCLQTFERMHEAVRILDSDSSDDEDDFSTILKPKDVYSDRPLPYIIGSQQWKTKWHIGLAPSESESDSDSEDYVKKAEPREQYSESESEDEASYTKEAAHVSSSSDMESEPLPGPSGVVKPADIAAQIAKRLAAQQPPLETESREPSIPESGARKLYRPEQPGTIPVFPEEPPPLENSFDDYSDHYSEEEDIFAELHRKPSIHRQRDSDTVYPFVDKLFGDEIIRDEQKQEEKVAQSVYTPISIKNDPKANTAKSTDTSGVEQTVKKPVGGVSVFGSSQGTESIGTAILKRNQRKSSSSDEGDKPAEENTQPDRIVHSALLSTNKIIEDLFTKPKSTKKESISEKAALTAGADAQKIAPKPKIDLFNDNIFDDVDDIFTSEIVTKPKETNQKSIFDDDDLFADVPAKTVVKENTKKSIFDSDDELFKDINESVSNDSKKPVVPKMNETSNKTNTETSIFSDDNVSDDIFTSNNNTPQLFQSRATPNFPDHKPTIRKNDISTIDKINNLEFNISKTLNPMIQPKKFESPLLFDDDDIDDLFISNMNASKIKESHKNEQVFDDESVIKATKVSQENDGKAPEQQNEKRTDLIVNNTESVGHLFFSPKSPTVEENNRNKPNNMLEVTNQSDYTNKDKNVNEDSDTVQNTKYINLDHQESIIETKNTKPVIVRNDSSVIPPAFDENVNSLGNPNTTESFTSSIKHNKKQHNELDDLFNNAPPDFEKPSEPKKSKNVNALFDDDSDDEALFFRKSDVTDEKPKASYYDDRFNIFHDEPPDVDVDFTTITDNTLKNVESDEALFTLPKSNASSKNTSDIIDNKPKDGKLSHPNIEQDDDIFTKTQDKLEIKNENSLDISKLLSSETIKTDNSEISNTVENQVPYITSEQNNKDVETSTKKSIGKLKPMNININVCSLMPGASPTKQKTKDESDGSAFSTQSNEELNKYSSENEESKMVKSVSFDGDAGSEVLDNKLSKGRARIQVKRRPSSRRARLEAVRKSGIDFADDSTDNSSSFDEPKPVSSDHSRSSDRKENIPVQTSSSDIVSSKTENTIVESDVVSNKLDNFEKNTTSEIKSKTVYILHDEDIFSNSPNTKTDNVKKSLTVLDDDDEDLFKNPSSMAAKNNKTSEKPKEEFKKNNIDVVPKTIKSIFDNLSDDEELFGAKKSSESSSSNVKSKDTEKISSALKTGSLFGDDSDDDDLFKTAKRTDFITKPKETSAVKSTAVKDDPLSLFDGS